MRRITYRYWYQKPRVALSPPSSAELRGRSHMNRHSVGQSCSQYSVWLDNIGASGHQREQPQNLRLLDRSTRAPFKMLWASDCPRQTRAFSTSLMRLDFGIPRYG